MSDDPAFSLDRVSLKYGDNIALDIDQLHIPENRVTVFEGPNGSGKTTLLKILCGLLEPFRGVIRSRGEEMDSPGLKSKVVFVHQNVYMLSGTVFRNVAYGLRIRHLPRHEVRARVSETLERLGLGEVEHNTTSQLSGGQRQRVAIARALVLDPEILLLDEPNANIDKESVMRIEEILGDLVIEGKTVVLSTHDSAFAYRVSENLVHLREGKIGIPQENLYRGSVKLTDSRFTYFQIDGETIKCPARDGDFAAAVLPYDDVVLSPTPVDTSAQNQIRGKVVGIEQVGTRYRVLLDCGIPIVAHITGFSIQRFHVTVSDYLYAVFKASAVKLY